MLDITKVPFNSLLGIIHANNTDYLLQLNAKEEYTNHLGTVHAAALFALAEGSGAQFMIKNFPADLIDQVIPVLRKAEVTYKKPAKGVIVSNAKLKEGTILQLIHDLQIKKRTWLLQLLNFLMNRKKRYSLPILNGSWFLNRI